MTYYTKFGYYIPRDTEINLIEEIGGGGEGKVSTTNHNGYVVKIYKNPTPEKEKKLKVMICNTPTNPTASQNHIAISWPIDLILDSQKNFVGFLMPEITNARQIIDVYNPQTRLQEAPRANWYCLHIVARNFVYILKEIHDKGHIIGDISPKNILVNERSLVSLIDTDSFQVKDSQTGQIYRCSVGTEGFIPPELVGKNLARIGLGCTNILESLQYKILALIISIDKSLFHNASSTFMQQSPRIVQTSSHDYFRLAVIIYYLLFGYHPFGGIWRGSGDCPRRDELVSQGYWPYRINSLLEPTPIQIPLNVAHPELEKLFLKCFNEGHRKPSCRPSPEDWLQALIIAINDLEVCSNNENHIYSRHYGKCYWCERDNNLGVDIFPSVENPIRPQSIPIPQQSSCSSQRRKSISQLEILALSFIKNLVNRRGKTIVIVCTIISVVLLGLYFFQNRERNQFIAPQQELQR